MSTDYLDVIVGDRTGRLRLAFGYDPYFNAAGKYTHDRENWHERSYDWPKQREKVEADIEAALNSGRPVDIYANPALAHSAAKGRRKGDALPPTVVWADLDGAPEDAALYAQLVALGAYVVDSGSPGHRHVYWPLTRPIDIGTFERLGQAFVERLGADHKWADNSLLRMPATYSRKAWAAGGEKAPVSVLLWQGQRRVDPDDLAELLGVDHTAQTGVGASSSERVTIEREPAPADLPPLVWWALNHHDVADRSEACSRLVWACRDAGLTPGQATTILSAYPPAERYRDHKQLEDDVTRLWGKPGPTPQGQACGEEQNAELRYLRGDFGTQNAQNAATSGSAASDGGDSGTQNPQNPQGPGGSEGFERGSHDHAEDGQRRSGGSEGFEGVSPEEWDEPTPLPGRTNPLPTDSVGSVLGPLAEAIGECLQVPTDLPITFALPIITTAVKGAWIAEVEPGWREPICVATLAALPSGEKKTPTLRILDAPLREFEREAQAEKKPEIAQQAAQRKLAEARVEDLRKAAVKGLDDGTAERQYLDEVAKLESLEVEPTPRWLIDDATPEKAVSLLAEHGAIGAVSGEPGLFGILAGRYSSGAPNIEWFLKATSGENITVDRQGRAGERIDNPALSVAAGIQPGRLVELGTVKAFRESGLLARWLFAIPQSAVGMRGATRQVPPAIVNEWAAQLSALARTGWKLRQAGEVRVLPLSASARDRLERFRASIEPHLHPDHGRYAGIADWANKLPGAAVRIAAAVTLLDDPDTDHIAEPVLDDAIRLATAYISHTIAAFGMIRPNAERYAQAKQVLAMFRRLQEEPGRAVTRRSVHQKLRDRAWVENADSLAGPIEILVDHGYLRLEQQPTGRPGRPSESYFVHPGNATQNPQNHRRTA